jgi:hypothetical protein
MRRPLKRDVLRGADLLIHPAPDLAGILKTDPDQICLWPVVDQDMGQSFAFGRLNRERRVKLEHAVHLGGSGRGIQ